MPILEPPRKDRTVTLPPRAARHGGRTDVLVVGGGPAGTAAAYAAADAGADVVLVERYGFLGGKAGRSTRQKASVSECMEIP
jgi:NADPH-dependent 2,4-dienoyl-CoA reductase/sulfur reductase-like enzyme